MFPCRHSSCARGPHHASIRTLHDLLTRASRVTGPSSSCVPHSQPVGCSPTSDTTPPRPYFSSRRSTERSPSPSRETERSASGTNIVFEANYPRPARSRTYASPIPLPRPSQGSLPTRAGSPLAGRASHPLDSKRNFMESSHSSNPDRPAEPGRTESTILPIDSVDSESCILEVRRIGVCRRDAVARWVDILLGPGSRARWGEA